MLAKIASAFGSDVYERYTAIYTWQSNQMAHAMMGFCFASLLILDVRLCGGDAWWGLAFILLPMAKDVTDLLVDLSKPRNDFPAPLGEMLTDAAADDFYWFSGTLAATAVAKQSDPAASAIGTACLWIALIVFVVFTIVWTSRRFATEKRRLDGAMLPYYARLPNIGSPMMASASSTIAAFLDGPAPGAGPRHLVVTGDPESGKTELAVAIGSELVVAGVAVRYETALKLYDYVEAGRPKRGLYKDEPIFAQDADALIVDDVEAPPPGISAPAGAVKAMPTPGFVQAIKAGQTKASRWVWVLDDPVTAAVWHSFLLTTFGPNASVSEVVLKQHDRPPQQPPSVAARIAAVVTLGAAAALIIATVVLVVCDLIRTRPGG